MSADRKKVMILDRLLVLGKGQSLEESGVEVKRVPDGREDLFLAECRDAQAVVPGLNTITRAMMDLLGMQALFVNAGLVYPPVVPCLDLYGDPGGDPRQGDAVPRAREVFSRGQQAGQLLSGLSDLLVLGECVPGGTTTALCVLRGLGHPAQVSSSFVNNPVDLKEEICRHVQDSIRSHRLTDPLDVVRVGGDPMIAAAAGILSTYRGHAILAGGTQMLAVAAVAGTMGIRVPPHATTVYVRDDPGAGFAGTAARLGARDYYVDPGFGDIGHRGLASLLRRSQSNRTGPVDFVASCRA